METVTKDLRSVTVQIVFENEYYETEEYSSRTFRDVNVHRRMRMIKWAEKITNAECTELYYWIDFKSNLMMSAIKKKKNAF